MHQHEFDALKPGDIVKHKSGSGPFLVHANYGGRATAIQVADLTNPTEWEQVDPCGQVISSEWQTADCDAGRGLEGSVSERDLVLAKRFMRLAVDHNITLHGFGWQELALSKLWKAIVDEDVAIAPDARPE